MARRGGEKVLSRLVWVVLAAALAWWVREGVAVAAGREVDAILLNEFPLIMSHDSASGELDESRDHIVAKLSKTQSTGLVAQLNCGARAFDYRPTIDDGTLYAHHGGVKIKKPMEESLQEILQWTAANPSDLVVLYLSHWDGDGCEEAVAQLLQKYGVAIVEDCSSLTSMTYGSAKALAAKSAKQAGYLLAVFDCTEENYDSSIQCYSHDYVCYDSWPEGTSDVPFQHLSDHLSNVTSLDPATHYKASMWMAQAHWQSSASTDTLCTLHGSSLVEDETRSKVNEWVRQAVLKGQFKYLNFLELDEVCDGGLDMYKALQQVYL